MVSEKLIAFILKAHQNKRNDDQITQQLLSVGWKQEAITDAFSEIKSHKMSAPTAAQDAKAAQDLAAQSKTVQQPQPAAPPWVKPVSTAQPAIATQQSTPMASAPAQPQTATQQTPLSSASQPASATASLIQPPLQNTSSQPQTPVSQSIPPNAVSQQQPVTPVTPIKLPSLPEKKSLFSSLFGKKQSPAQPQPAPTAQLQPTPAAQPQPMPTKQVQPAPSVQPIPTTQPQPTPAAQPQPMPTKQAQQASASQFPPAMPSAQLRPPVTPSIKPPVFPHKASVQSSAPAAQPQPSGISAPAQSTLTNFSDGSRITPVADAEKPIVLPASKPASSMIKFLPIIALVLLLAAAGAYYFLVFVPAQNIAPPTPSTPLAPPIPQNTSPVPENSSPTIPLPSVQNNTSSNQTPLASGPTICGTNGYDCLISAAQSCKPANATLSTSLDMFGIVVTTKSNVALLGAPSGRCPFYIHTVSTTAALSASAKAAMLAKGATDQDILTQEREWAQAASSANGLEGTCLFKNSDLAAMLANWKAGKLSSKDYDTAVCSGSMFEPKTTIIFGNSSSTNKSSANTSGTIKANTTAKTNTTIKTNATNSTVKNTTASVTNTTNTTGSTLKNTTNTSGAANISLLMPVFNYSNRYTTYFPEHLVWFCPDRNITFYRMHWIEYYGGNCNTPKPKEGYVNFSDYEATGCISIPCCINGPYDEYSRSYNYFECGYN